MLTRAPACASLFVTFATYVCAQQPTAKPLPLACLIEGRVLKDANSESLAGAIVTLRLLQRDGGVLYTISDAGGRFRFLQLKAGTYELEAERNGYVRQPYGAPPGRQRTVPLTLVPGEQAREITIRMVLSGVISGRVFDSDGEPMVRVRVNASRYSGTGADRRLNAVAGSYTNDRGEYRIYGQPPGAYRVSASFDWSRVGRFVPTLPENATPETAPAREEYATTYYPNSLDAPSAGRVQIKAGEEIAGIDIPLASIRVFSVKGHVVVPTERKLSGRAYAILSQPGRGGVSARITYDGAFEFAGVRPGKYQLFATVQDPQSLERTLSAYQEITILNSDVEGIRLTLVAGVEVSGRLRMEENMDSPKAATLVLRTLDENAFEDRTRLKPDGTFAFGGVRPGTYTIRVIPDSGDSVESTFHLRQARLGGQDVRDRLVVSPPGVDGLELIGANDAGSLTGMVLNAENLPVPGATLLLYRRFKNELLDDARSVQADQHGRFQFKGLPLGEYALFAFNDDDHGESDAEFRKKYAAKGQPVKIEPSHNHTLDVQVLVFEELAP